MSGQTPEYLRTPIPAFHGHLFGDRQTNVINTIFCRTDRFQNSFYPNSIVLWNELGPELRGLDSLSLFKSSILKLYRPKVKSVFDILDPTGLKWIFQLRVGLSPLKSHKKSHKFLDTPDDICSCTIDAETTEHYFLYCPHFNEQRRLLFQTINPLLLANNTRFLEDKDLIHLLLYGYEDINLESNKIIIKLNINFIRVSSRFL